MSASNNEQTVIGVLDARLSVEQDYPLQLAEPTTDDAEKQRILDKFATFSERMAWAGENVTENTQLSKHLTVLEAHLNRVIYAIDAINASEQELEDWKIDIASLKGEFKKAFPPANFPLCLSPQTGTSSVPTHGNILQAISAQYDYLQQMVEQKLNPSAPSTSASNAPTLPLNSPASSLSFGVKVPVSLKSSALEEEPDNLSEFSPAPVIRSQRLPDVQPSTPQAFNGVKNDFLDSYYMIQAVDNSYILMRKRVNASEQLKQFDQEYKITESLNYFIERVNLFERALRGLADARQKGVTYGDSNNLLKQLSEERAKFEKRFPRNVYGDPFSLSNKFHPLCKIEVSFQRIERDLQAELGAVSQSAPPPEDQHPTSSSSTLSPPAVATFESEKGSIVLRFETDMDFDQPLPAAKGKDEDEDEEEGILEVPSNQGFFDKLFGKNEPVDESYLLPSLNVGDRCPDLYSAAVGLISVATDQRVTRYPSTVFVNLISSASDAEKKKISEKFNDFWVAAPLENNNDPSGTMPNPDKDRIFISAHQKPGFLGNFFGAKPVDTLLCFVAREKGISTISTSQLPVTVNERKQRIEGAAIATGILVGRWQQAHRNPAPAMVINGENLSCKDVLILMKQLRRQGVSFKVHVDLHTVLAANAQDSGLREYQSFMRGTTGGEAVQLVNSQSPRQNQQPVRRGSSPALSDETLSASSSQATSTDGTALPSIGCESDEGSSPDRSNNNSPQI
jgi:hypothetical protein